MLTARAATQVCAVAATSVATAASEALKAFGEMAALRGGRGQQPQ